MRRRKASLTGKLFFTMIGIVAGTVILCWFFNNTFLERFYIYNKQTELYKGYQLVNEAWNNHTLENGAFDVTFENICANGNIDMLVVDRKWRLVRSSYSNTQYIQIQLENLLFGTDRSSYEVLVEGKNYLIEKQTDERLQSEYLVLIGNLDQGGYLYMRTALQSIRESAEITNRFFLMVSGVTMAVSLIIILFLSQSISRPIRLLSHISRRMSDLDFEAKYVETKHASREIAELGNSMNELSEHLEKTISELKTANLSLQQDIAKKEEIDEMRKEFLSNVSHELKTPLALIQGYAEGLIECVNEDEGSRQFYCEVIMDEADKMNRMVRKLLTLNQLEFGNEKVELVRFDLVELIRGLLLKSSLMAEQNHVTVSFLPKRPVYVWGEELMVEEVLTNYLTNAYHYAAGEKRVEISITTPGKTVRVSVYNTGEPIPAEELEKIWIKFYKVDKARSREYGGNGIGLSIVKAIMDSLGQSYGVLNHADGVEFWMELENSQEISESSCAF